ncbi:MAG: transglutaminase domain-containing protein [Oscillospiraceae bacterium]|nr:transglutaminase domain-containing protein [Oscillospiraceae bacterium]
MEETKTKKKRSSLTGTLTVLSLTVALLAGVAYVGYVWVWPRLRFDAAAQEPAATPAPTATPRPAPPVHTGYMVSEDGLFYPERTVTAGELARALELAAEQTLEIDDPAEELTEDRFAALLVQKYAGSRVSAVMDSISYLGDEQVTRAETAVCLNRLLGIEPAAEGDYFPDVEPGYWAAGDIASAAVSLRTWPGEDGHPEPGLLFVDGGLYFVEESGYFRKNAFQGTLLFGPDGKYTSGSRELDGYVEDVIRNYTDDSMAQDERLYACYCYVRDSFTYLRRNYYKVGDVGWQLQEALTMFSTGKGNCYCYAAAFWSLARGVGYDAKIVSGTCGGDAPHGWVEIVVDDGYRLTYDVELEMVQRNREGILDANFFAMNDVTRRRHNYIEQPFTDDLVPRETNEGLLPQ